MARSAAAALVLLLASAAGAREIAGVQVPDTATVGEQTLRLNGAGVRKKFIVKVYVGALYLPAASSDPAAIVAADAPRAVTLTFLRDVSQKQMMDAFREGFEKNSAEAAKALEAKLPLLAPAMPDVKEGQVLEFRYLPGTGSIVGLQGLPPVTVPGKDFADALLRNWLGPEPADGGLKEGMLGL